MWGSRLQNIKPHPRPFIRILVSVPAIVGWRGLGQMRGASRTHSLVRRDFEAISAISANSVHSPPSPLYRRELTENNLFGRLKSKIAFSKYYGRNWRLRLRPHRPSHPDAMRAKSPCLPTNRSDAIRTLVTE
jgi:hypothetical protein